jgi:hypothetical protein
MGDGFRHWQRARKRLAVVERERLGNEVEPKRDEQGDAIRMRRNFTMVAGKRFGDEMEL